MSNSHHAIKQGNWWVLHRSCRSARGARLVAARQLGNTGLLTVDRHQPTIRHIWPMLHVMYVLHVLHVLHVMIITRTEWRFPHRIHFWCLFSPWMKCSKTLNNSCFGWNFETRYSDTAGSSCLLICSWKPFQSFWCTSLQRVTCSPEFDPKR